MAASPKPIENQTSQIKHHNSSSSPFRFRDQLNRK